MMSSHMATFSLLGFEPQNSDAAAAAIEEAEKRLGLSLPLSVRDWYLRQDAIKILAEHSNNDPPIPIEEFTLTNWQSHRLLPFRNENQGVCTWAIDLNRADDPAVYVDVDTNGKEWQLLASSFSQYVYSCVWDYRRVFGQPALVEAQNCALSPAALKTLTALFRQETQTHGWPGSTQYRFFKDGQAILIWSSERQADWFVGASSAETLECALVRVWDIDEVGKSFYDCSKVGREVLKKISSKTPLT